MPHVANQSILWGWLNDPLMVQQPTCPGPVAYPINSTTTDKEAHATNLFTPPRDTWAILSGHCRLDSRHLYQRLTNTSSMVPTPIPGWVHYGEAHLQKLSTLLQQVKSGNGTVAAVTIGILSL